MDNTAAPLLARPFDHGAAIIVYSSTKYLGGHGTSIGGADRRRRQFPLGRAPGAPARAQHARSELSRRGLDARRSSRSARRLHHQGARRRCCATSAAAMSPFNAFLTLQGIETLALRMERHCANAAGGRGLARQAAGGRRRSSTLRPADGRRQRARREISQGRAGRPRRLRDSRAASEAGRRVHRRAASCSITSPISATRAASPSIRRRPRIRSSRPRSSSRPASPTAMCACRSASSISTTSSPISIRR